MPTPVTIPITPGSGQNLDATQVTVNSNTVAREVTVIGDPTTAANYAAVNASGQQLVVDAADGAPGSAAPTEATLVGGSDGTNLRALSSVAKGTQGAFGVATQDLKDSGRSKVILSSTKVTSITAEALLTLTQKKGDATTTTGTSYTVTAGKTLRIQEIKLYAQFTTAATAAWVSCRVREGAASGGAVSTTSDIISIVESNTVAVTDVIGMGVAPCVVNFPDGLEIAGGQNIGISELALNADLAVTVILIGYEY